MFDPCSVYLSFITKIIRVAFLVLIICCKTSIQNNFVQCINDILHRSRLERMMYINRMQSSVYTNQVFFQDLCHFSNVSPNVPSKYQIGGNLAKFDPDILSMFAQHTIPRIYCRCTGAYVTEILYAHNSHL